MTISADLAALALTDTARQAFRAAGTNAENAIVLVDLQIAELRRLIAGMIEIYPRVDAVDGSNAQLLESILGKI